MHALLQAIGHDSRVSTGTAQGAAPDQTRPALVVVSHGATARLRLDDGNEVLARAPGRRLQYVCGDRVVAGFDGQHGQWLLQSVLPRSSLLQRTNARGQAEPIAANLSLLVIVVAPRPEPDLFMVDRYLAAAASAGIGALLVMGKQDLGYATATADELTGLAAAGCDALACSAVAGTGLDALRARLAGERVMLAGQSGVGKSSLLRVLVPGADAAVGELMRDDSGRHTTSASRLYDLPGGGALIDSPGVRDFAPAPEGLEPATLGFFEVAQLMRGCRFANCRHMEEPGCAVRAAVADGSMAARRYESYRRLRRLHNDLLERAGPRRR
jgi:ribosome biogenesis GTPase